MDRREFLKTATLGAVLIPAGSMLLNACLDGGGKPPEGKTALSETDAIASALGYKADGSQVDKTKFPRKEPSMSCLNCVQYSAIDGSWGNCKIFTQGVVASAGWCNSWVEKPKA